MILGIDDNVMLDSSKVKIIDSIAGAGKSSMLDSFLRSNGVEYLRLTSTNTLKADAIERFGGNVKTICAGIFDNTEGFRTAEKEIDYKTVVLDEVLQDGYKALEWVKNHIGKGINIILTTDSHQMLAPESEEKTLYVFEELKKDSNVVYSNIDITLRGINATTRDAVRDLYYSDGALQGENVWHRYNTEIWANVTYDKNNVYLCHTKEIEHYLYKNFDLSDCDLIGKGRQSGKIPVPGKYPLLDELTANLKHVQNYYQAKNIATPTRYQGSEVEPGRTGYYFLECNSLISMRELYTVVSRFKDIADLRIVMLDFNKTKELTEFKGKRVKDAAHLTLDKFDGQTHIVSTDEIAEIVAKYSNNRLYYTLDWIYALDGEELHIQYLNERCKLKAENAHCLRTNKSNWSLYLDNDKKPQYKKSTAGSLCKKAASIQYDYMANVYECVGDTFKGAMVKNERGNTKENYEHQADLFSAFGTVIKFSKMPIAGEIYTTYDANKLNWYVCNNKELTGLNNLITEDLATYLHMVDCKYAFTTDYSVSNEIGDYIYTMARKSKEDKDKTRLNWGYFEKHYIEMIKTGVKDGDSYKIDSVPIVNKSNNNELFLCAVKSALACIMLKARDSVNGGYIVTDAIYYNGDIKPELPDWVDYRICKGSKDCNNGEYEGVEYQTYELKTRAELKREQVAKRRAEETPEQAEERRRKNRERMARKRAEAKQAPKLETR